MKTLSVSLLCLIAFQIWPGSFAAEKPVFLYSRYFNAKGESRYLPDGNYKEVLELLSKDFEVRVHDKPLNAENLRDVSVILISNPSDSAVGTNPAPYHVDQTDIQEISKYLDEGGGLIVMGNQENHNLEINDMNKLLGRFGIQFTNLYTDAKKLVLPKETPVVGGLRWAYYTGNLLQLNERNSAKPVGVVQNDLAQKPEKGTRDEKGVLMASATPGRGRVLVVTDAGWICDWAFHDQGVGGVAIKGQDNWEIFRRLVGWTAGRDKKRNKTR
jgi:hypothetical protein